MFSKMAVLVQTLMFLCLMTRCKTKVNILEKETGDAAAEMKAQEGWQHGLAVREYSTFFVPSTKDVNFHPYLHMTRGILNVDKIGPKEQKPYELMLPTPTGFFLHIVNILPKQGKGTIKTYVNGKQITAKECKEPDTSRKRKAKAKKRQTPGKDVSKIFLYFLYILYLYIIVSFSFNVKR
uniref:Uncharacterized protein n=1 Tax=Glossina brevipalpis TaxID=37001 RepID=A0A1A9WGY8_9MUSC